MDHEAYQAAANLSGEPVLTPLAFDGEGRPLPGLAFAPHPGFQEVVLHDPADDEPDVTDDELFDDEDTLDGCQLPRGVDETDERRLVNILFGAAADPDDPATVGSLLEEYAQMKPVTDPNGLEDG